MLFWRRRENPVTSGYFLPAEGAAQIQIFEVDVSCKLHVLESRLKKV